MRCRKIWEEKSGGSYTEPTMGELQKSENGGEKAIMKEKESRKRAVSKIKE